MNENKGNNQVVLVLVLALVFIAFLAIINFNNATNFAFNSIGTDTLQSVTDRGNITTQNITASYYFGDGSFLTGISGNVTENDTLQSVTDRGASTTNAITIDNNLTVNGTVDIKENNINTIVFRAESNWAVNTFGSPNSQIVSFSNGGVVRSFIRATGAQRWVLHSGTSEVGEIAYGTPENTPGITFFRPGADLVDRTQLRLRIGGGLLFSARTGAAPGATGMIETLAILPGLVGIRTPIPAKQLTLRTVDSTDGILINRNINTNNEYTSLFFSVSTTQAGKGAIFFQRTGTNGIGSLHFATTTNTNNGIFITPSDARMTITSGGNIGIGTTTPSQKLHVDGNGLFNGTVTATDFITTSRVADFESSQRSLDKLSNVNEWTKSDGSLDYEKHYSFTSKIVEVVVGNTTVKKMVESCDYELINDINEKVCKNIITNDIQYIYEEIEIKGLSMETRIAEMEKMIWELKQENIAMRKRLNRLEGVKG
jgi:hypothetical protein